MFKFLLFSLFISVSLSDSVLNGTELVLTFLVHRHGDRTPISTTFSNDPATLEELTAQYGYGQLTDAGRLRGYQLGQFLRSRYDELLSDKYNRSEIYIRSTDSTRTKMTVLAAMAAVYPTSEDNWSDSIDWTPVPYTTVPAKYDFNLAVINCPTFLAAYYSSFLTTSPAMEAYSDVLNTWSEYLSFNITALPVMAYNVYDLYTAQISLGLPLEDGVAAILPEIEEVAGAAIDIAFGDDNYIALQAGVLLNEFFEYADMVIDGEDTPKVRVYSAHDLNVYAFEAVTQVTERQGVPKYGSMYALELRRVTATGQYVVLVHRHGDRTPISTTFSNDPATLEELTAQYGYGQLTDAGRLRGYQLGQFLRSRYDELLSDKYNRSEIYIRSTDSTRTKMTVLAAMAAVYPTSEDNWSDSIDWTPVPYTTVPAKYDFNLAVINCPTFLAAYYSSFLTTSPAMEAYSDVLNTWSEYLSFNITALPVMAYNVYDLYTAQISLGLPLEDGVAAILPEIEEVAGAAIDIAFGDDNYIALQAGVLLNEFFEYADMVIDGEDTPKVRVYSAHDLNVYAFEAVTQVTERQGVPKYGSMYALELRRVTATGQYVVLPVYLPTPSSDEVLYLPVTGCDDLLCDYDQFRNVTSDYVLDERDLEGYVRLHGGHDRGYFEH